MSVQHEVYFLKKTHKIQSDKIINLKYVTLQIIIYRSVSTVRIIYGGDKECIHNFCMEKHWNMSISKTKLTRITKSGTATSITVQMTET